MLTPTGATITEYWNAIKSGNPTHVKMEFTGQNVTIEDDDIDISTGVIVTDIFNGDTDITFGRAVMKKVETRILLTSKTEFLKWTGEFALSFGVEISGTTNWVTIGTFYGERPSNVKTVNAVDFVAYDRMHKFDVLIDEYIDTLTTNDYPISVQELYEGICTYVGVNYAAGDPLANAYARTFNEGDLDLKGFTCRTVLAWIAEACGCYAKITADGKCKLAWFSSNTSYTVTANEEFHIEHADLYDGMIWNEFDALTWNEADMMTWDDVCGFYQDVYGVYGVKVKQTDLDIELDYPQEFSQNIYLIMDNPFLMITDPVNDPVTYVKPIYDRLTAFGGQLPMQTECIGNWLVEAGDIITIYVMNEMIESPVFVRSLKWNGGIRDIYETTGNKRRTVVTSEKRERMVTSKQIRLFVSDNYYEQQSGIDIKPEGIEIIGGKYLKLMSGGVLDVQSTNFVLSSADKKMVAGSWQFNDDGIKYDSNSVTFPFYIGKRNDSDIIPSNKPGLYYYVESNVGGIQLYACSKQNDDPYSASLELSTIYNSTLGKRVSTLYLFDNGGDSDYDLNIGGAVYPISTGYFINLKSIGGTISGNKYVYSTGLIYMYPRNVANSYIVFQEYTYNSAHYTKIYGSIGANMIFEGQHTAPSSRDIKHDIKNLESQGETIDKLNPVSFVYDNDPGEQKHYGLIYEDTIKVAPEVCTKDESSKAINYVELIPVLLKEIQDLRARVKTLEERLGEQ